MKTKQEIQELIKAVLKIIEKVPKGKRLDAIEEVNSLFLYLEEQKKEAK